TPVLNDVPPSSSWTRFTPVLAVLRSRRARSCANQLPNLARATYPDPAPCGRRCRKSGGVTMPLSEYEQRVLDEMEQQLRSDDPKLARTISGGAPRRPLHVALGGFVVIAGIGLL